MEENKIPRDEFSQARRQLINNPATIGAQSRLDVVDFYGRVETWTVDTFRADGNDWAFLQRMAPESSLRLVLPPEVMAALGRHQVSLDTKTRSRGAQKALETRRLRGDTIGNPEALRKARAQRKRRK